MQYKILTDFKEERAAFATSKEVLIILSKDESVTIRRFVARNINTPPEVLIILSKDKDIIVRQRVFENVSSPEEALLNIKKLTMCM